MQEKIKNQHKEITHIQNTIWAMYKEFLENHDMKKWNEDMGSLTKEYYKKADKALLNFVRFSLITWCPIIEEFAEEFRNSE